MSDNIIKNIPSVVKKSYLCWLFAIAAGVFEMALAIIQRLAENSVIGHNIIVQIFIRSVIFAILLFIIVKMLKGKNWARIVLTVLPGGIGIISLIIGPIQLLLEGSSLYKAVFGLSNYSFIFGISRIFHLIFVVFAMILMYRPTANKYFLINNHALKGRDMLF